jgi:hypothetical protein
MSRKALTHCRLFLTRALPQGRSICLLFSMVLASLPLVPCGADELARRQPIVLVLVYSSGQTDNQALSAMIADAFSMELESQGIRAVAVSERAPDDQAVAALAAKNRADFALWGTYVQVGSQVQLNARWIDPGTKAVAGHSSRTGALNLSFDAVVTSLVDEILEGQKQQIANLPLAPVERIPPPALPAEKPAGTEKKERFPHFAFSLGSAPFIATFQALNYFPLGLSASLTGRYQIPAPGGFLGFGLTSGLSGFHGKGSYAEADFYVIPTGIDVLYGTRTGSLLDFFVHVNGGPAVFMATLTSGETLAKVIPYVSGGVGVSLSLFDSLAIALEGGYTCFFDYPDPIMGFAPSLSIILRL